MTDKPIIEVQEVSFNYPGGENVLQNVNLSILEGEYVAIVGQNGSGKTTLAKHFNGLLKPVKGEVYTDGMSTNNVTIAELSRLVGYVFQNPDDMLFSSSVEEEIGYGPRILELDDDEIDNRVQNILQMLGLEALRDQHPFSLSLGDRQRLAVACALSLEPDVFLFDEPTTGQDFVGAKQIMDIIDTLHSSGKTIIIITHDMRIVAEYTQRVVVMNEGRISLDAPPEKAFTESKTLKKLSLLPPQVTQLAEEMSWKSPAILSVDNFCDRFELIKKIETEHKLQ